MSTNMDTLKTAMEHYIDAKYHTDEQRKDELKCTVEEGNELCIKLPLPKDSKFNPRMQYPSLSSEDYWKHSPLGRLHGELEKNPITNKFLFFDYQMVYIEKDPEVTKAMIDRLSEMTQEFRLQNSIYDYLNTAGYLEKNTHTAQHSEESCIEEESTLSFSVHERKGKVYITACGKCDNAIAHINDTLKKCGLKTGIVKIPDEDSSPDYRRKVTGGIEIIRESQPNLTESIESLNSLTKAIKPKNAVTYGASSEKLYHAPSCAII